MAHIPKFNTPVLLHLLQIAEAAEAYKAASDSFDPWMSTKDYNEVLERGVQAKQALFAALQGARE